MIIYFLFLFFPQLIAGPIVHHKPLIAQTTIATNPLFRSTTAYVVGLSFLGMGLFKKVIFADSFARYATPIFDLAQHTQPSLESSWQAMLAYTLQLYFDFSGYSDMAIGLSLLFGVHLPLNFNSPYKAKSISEFWRRWHMTLSRFLRDYLYIPLGGNRNGNFSRYFNLMVTMILGGLWHGAGWTFLVWGTLHGIYLVINHTFSRFSNCLKFLRCSVISWGLTFLAVVVAWVFFRAPDLAVGMTVIKGMCGLNGIIFPVELSNIFPWLRGFAEINFSQGDSHKLLEGFVWTFIAFVISVFGKNSQEIVEKYSPNIADSPSSHEKTWLSWKPNILWAAIISIVFTLCFLKLGYVSEFLYFQF